MRVYLLILLLIAGCAAPVEDVSDAALGAVPMGAAKKK